MNKFFKKNGKFLGKNDRFSVIYFPTNKKVKRISQLKNLPIDLKIRITNKKAELALKYGKWGAKDSRKEFLFPFDSKKFDEMVEFLKVLDFYQGVLNATSTLFYKYKGIEFSLVKIPDWGYYFEAEIVTDPKDIKKADKKIIEECKRLGISTFDYSGFCKMLDDLNDRPGYRFNFKRQNFSEIKKRFINYL